MSTPIKPGPMGYGVKKVPEYKWADEEKRAYDHIARVAPQYLTRGEAKTPNSDLMAKVDEIQKANGIESGFCFLFLTQAVFGKQFNWLAQLIGSCVASGDMRTTAYRMLAEIFLFNDPEELPGIDITGTDSLAFFAPYNYRAGRKIGGINGSSDGSFCVPHIQGKMKYGHLKCSTIGLTSDTFPEPQNQSLYRQWGGSDALLNKYADEGRKLVLLESEAVDDADEYTILCREHKKPANICSSWSFVPDYQHPTWEVGGEPVWIWKRGRQPWHHNMSVIGDVTVDGKDFIIIENSWHNYHKGRKWFAIPKSLYASWLKAARCQSVGEIDMTDNSPVWPE